MTPTERARLIDQQEFEAESKAVLQRALSYSAQCRKEERARIMGYVKVEQPSQQPTSRTHARRYAHDGKNLTIAEWASLTGLSDILIRGRLGRGWPIARALTEREGAQQITIAGRTLTRNEWADFLGINYSNLYRRIRKHGSLEAVVEHYMEQAKARSPRP